MKWAPVIGAVSVLTLLSGCSRGPVAGIDPFGPTTIPPPGTRAVQGPVVAPAQVDPYYSGPVSTAPRLVPVGPQSGTINSAPAASAPTGFVSQNVEQDDWRRADLAPATGRLRPVSSSFLASDPGGSAVRASAELSDAGNVARTEYRESTSRLNWQQPGASTATSARTVTSGSLTRVELAQLPRNASRGDQVTAATASASPAAAPVARYGFSHDYRWLKGQLEYSAAQQQWKLRYIPIDGQTDRFGGSVVLESVPELSNFRNGDFIQVQGVAQGQNATASPNGTAYRITRLARLQ
ncbi:MAG: hypothetical protein OES79_04985 [Planctomycetota bacterium]|nr:hypothetical protein [Planctomycetota bacterium]